MYIKYIFVYYKIDFCFDLFWKATEEYKTYSSAITWTTYF